MRLPALLGHAAELLRIINKSYQPSDKIMSDYFRKKKYIGSSERRFLSELVFTTLRNYNLIDYCMNQALDKCGKRISKENIDDGLMFTATAAYLFEIIENYHTIFQPSKLIEKFNENKNYFDNLIIALDEKAKFEKKESEEFLQTIKLSFEELDAKSKLIGSQNTAQNKDISQIISKRFSVHEWIIERWLNNKFIKMGVDEVCNLSESLLFPAPLTVRVNLSYITREEAIETFRKKEINCESCLLSPSGIIVTKRTQLNTLDIFKKGFIEVQDEGSHLISFALNPDEKEKILDACAGAGGKTLHIADIQKNSGQIISSDVDSRKLRELLKRAKRSGFNSIKTQNLSNSDKSPLRSERGFRGEVFDRVLVDAPCSGMGTVRRMPMQKWRLTPELLKKHSDKQLKILGYYSKFVRDGGILLYSTCSLMSEENEEVVDKFLSQNNSFKPNPLKPAFNRFNIKISGLTDDSYMLRISPAQHGCDGFFIAKMIREE